MEWKKSLVHKSKTECCMCGDYGLSSELVQCQTCHFRSQHRYCSNLYPKAESYGVCNWCLVQELDDKAKHKTQKSDQDSRKNRGEDLTIEMIKKTKNKSKKEQSIHNHDDDDDVGREINSAIDHRPIELRSRSRPPAGSERVTVGCSGGAKGRESRKAQVNVSSNKRGVRKMVRRRRRYKFLDEVLASKIQI